MIKNDIIISGYEEMLALHKALMEAKFHPEPENLMVSGSPLVASISNRVVEALVEMEIQKNPSKQDSWKRWLDIKNQKTFWNRALEYACEFNYWGKFTEDEKRHYVSCLLSPFKFDENDILRFINEVDAKL